MSILGCGYARKTVRNAITSQEPNFSEGTDTDGLYIHIGYKLLPPHPKELRTSQQTSTPKVESVGRQIFI